MCLASSGDDIKNSCLKWKIIVESHDSRKRLSGTANNKKNWKSLEAVKRQNNCHFVKNKIYGF